MGWNPNSARHKATHCGYKGKPTKEQVNALLGLYGDFIPKKTKATKPIDNQLKMF